MALPIQATPPITGKAAEEFLERMNAAVMTPERLAYLKQAAEESKAACERGKNR